MDKGQHVVIVNIEVKPACIDDFIALTMRNVEASRQEPGILAFDLVRNQDVPTNFYLIEIYASAAGHAAHKETEHYKRFKAEVDALLPHPYTSGKYSAL